MRKSKKLKKKTRKKKLITMSKYPKVTKLNKDTFLVIKIFTV